MCTIHTERLFANSHYRNQPLGSYQVVLYITNAPSGIGCLGMSTTIGSQTNKFNINRLTSQQKII